MLRINYRDLQVFGGLTICLPYLLVPMLLGSSSRHPLGDTITPRADEDENSGVYKVNKADKNPH